MAKQNNVSELRNLDYNHKENLFDVRQDVDGQYYYDLSDTIYTDEEILNPTNYTRHEITFQDNLFSISQKYYGTKSWWWVIGVTNNIENPFTFRNRVGDELKIINKSLVGSLLDRIQN